MDRSSGEDPVDSTQMLIDHIKAIRKRPQFATALITFVVENNLGNEAIWLVNRLEEKMPNHYNIKIYRENVKDPKTGTIKKRVGFKTDSLNKEDAVGILDERLYKKTVHIYQTNRCTTDKTPYDFIQTREDYIDARIPSSHILLDELSNYSRKYIPSKTDLQEGKYKFTGKSGGRCDDASMAILINSYVANEIGQQM
jgi:hypothetical protein